MKQQTPNTGHSLDTNADAETIRERVFSTEIRVCAVFVSGVLASLAIGSTALAQERWAARVLALIALASTVMLWLRHRYAVYAWAFLFAAMGAGTALLNDPGHHSLLYWSGRFGTALSLFWFAYQLFKLGKQVADHTVQ